MNYTPLKTRSMIASVGIVFLVIANIVFDVTNNASTDQAASLSAAGMLLAGALLAGILFCVWFHGAAKNLRAIHPGSVFAFTPGWAVGWFFVPLASFWKPFQVMKEVWAWSEPDVVDGGAGAFLEPPPLLIAWWTTYVGYRLADNIAGRITDASASSAIGMVSTALCLAAAVCIIGIMRTVTANQQEAWERRSKKPILSDALKHAADTANMQL